MRPSRLAGLLTVSLLTLSCNDTAPLGPDVRPSTGLAVTGGLEATSAVEVHDLGLPWPEYRPGDINSTGTVVGLKVDYELRRVWGLVVADGVPELVDSQGLNGINDAGQFVGAVNEFPFSQQAARWEPDGTRTLLQTLKYNSIAVGINDLGESVGWSGVDAPLESRAVVWSSEGQPVAVDGIPGWVHSGRAINNLGHIVGSRFEVGEYDHLPFYWSPETGSVEPEIEGLHEVTLRDLNDLDEVVGYGRREDGSYVGFIWSPNEGVAQEFAGAPGESYYLVGVNNRGEVAGTFTELDGTSHGFGWSAHAGVIDLPSLGGESSSTRTIAENGLILGLAETGEGSEHLVVWSFPPEPSFQDLVLELEKLVADLTTNGELSHGQGTALQAAMSRALDAYSDGRWPIARGQLMGISFRVSGWLKGNHPTLTSEAGLQITALVEAMLNVIDQSAT